MKFYRTKLVIDILSEEPTDHLHQALYAQTEECLSTNIKVKSVARLSRRQAVKYLKQRGLDPCVLPDKEDLDQELNAVISRAVLRNFQKLGRERHGDPDYYAKEFAKITTSQAGKSRRPKPPSVPQNSHNADTLPQ